MQALRSLARVVVVLALALPLAGVSRVGTIRAEEQSGLQTLTIQSAALHMKKKRAGRPKHRSFTHRP